MVKFSKKVFRKILLKANDLGMLNNLDDKKFIEILFNLSMPYKLDLSCPRKFNEKIQFLKLFDRNPVYTQYVDKIEVKKIITSILGDEYVIPTIGVYTNAKDIDFDKLPNSFVLKCNHNSHDGLCVCPSKRNIVVDRVKKDLNKALNINYFYRAREWPYKNVVPKILAEKYISDQDNLTGLTDYKFFCFNGFVPCVMVCSNRMTGETRFVFLDRNKKILKYNKSSLSINETYYEANLPENFDRMFEIASILSKGFPFVRIDLYNVKGRIYFGEFTLYPDGGLDSNLLEETELYFGDLIDLNLCYSIREVKDTK